MTSHKAMCFPYAGERGLVILGSGIETSPVFWFMMRIAILAGVLTSYPVKRRLNRSGITEAR